MGSPRNPKSNPCRLCLDFNAADYWHLSENPAPEGIYTADEAQSVYYGTSSVLQEMAVPIVAAVENVRIIIEAGNVKIYVGGLCLDYASAQAFILNDGFDTTEDFIKFFYSGDIRSVWEGQLIHWKSITTYNPDAAQKFDYDATPQPA